MEEEIEVDDEPDLFIQKKQEIPLHNENSIKNEVKDIVRNFIKRSIRQNNNLAKLFTIHKMTQIMRRSKKLYFEKISFFSKDRLMFDQR